MSKNLQLLTTAIVSMLVAFLVNRKLIPELIRDRIFKFITLIGLILLFIYTHTDVDDYIISSIIGFQVGWVIKDLQINSHRSKK